MIVKLLFAAAAFAAAASPTLHNASYNYSLNISNTKLESTRVVLQATEPCVTHTVANGEVCSSIARDYGISTLNIEVWNAYTWRFLDCENIQVSQTICVSPGHPPMPPSDPEAVCGPQVEGTEVPQIWGDLGLLNPCPLSACCSSRGQCGHTEEFCDLGKPYLGPTAISPVHRDGCISNCGTQVGSGTPTKDAMTIGYYEGSSSDRECMAMEPLQIPADKYTHLHFAFANISQAYEVELYGAMARRWNEFRTISGPKIICSFGGWAFSNAAETRSLFADALSDPHRQTFIESLVRFVNSQGIDGLDFDWEYPGGLASPGVEAGNAHDGELYLSFLRDLRAVLPSDKTISIAAPAAYWNLKAFPIAEMAEVVDYIVYMTYDMHGQWDYGSKYSVSGCDNGNCLRSHVNLTETNTALSMITKAGVPPEKVIVGVASYGRSFQMTEFGYTGPDCTFTGPDSGALPGACTKTPGILAKAEIDDILETNPVALTWYDYNSNSDFMVYDATQWVAYISETTKSSRHSYYLSRGFRGTADWAIDLAQSGATAEYESFSDCSEAGKYSTVDDVVNDPNIPLECVNTYLLSALALEMQEALEGYHEIMENHYKKKQEAFEKQIKAAAPTAMEKFYSAGGWDKYFECNYQFPKTRVRGDNGEYDTEWTNVTYGCPPDHEFTGAPEGWQPNIYWVLRHDQDQQVVRDAFCKDASLNWGIDCEWMGVIRRRYVDMCAHTVEDCAMVGHTIRPDLLDEFDVVDPADEIKDSLSNFTDFSDWLHEAALLATLDLFPEQVADAVDAAGLMVANVQAAVDAMNQVAEIGEEALEEEKKAMILAFVSAILFIVPAIAAEARIVFIARLAALAGEAGNAALAIYEVVENPEGAPLAVAGILLGAAIVRDAAAWGRAGRASRALERDSVLLLGESVLQKMDKIRRTRNVCQP